MCDIALVYSQWLCFDFERRQASLRGLNDLSGLFTGDKKIQSAVIEEQTMSSSLVQLHREVKTHETDPVLERLMEKQ